MPNVPAKATTSTEKVKKFFTEYYSAPLEFPSNEVDAVVGFLENKGFDKSAAKSTGSILLQQAKIDGVKVFELLDTLKGLEQVQLSVVVAQILNFNRQKISTLGFRIQQEQKPLESRNIMG